MMRKGYMKDVLNAIMSGLVNYIKATLKLSALVYIILAIGLRLIGVDLWSIKALGIAFIDMIPILGSGIVMIPWAIIHFLIGNTTLAWQIGLLYIVIVVFRQIFEPVITGKAIGVRPLYTFLSTIVCMILFGPLGAILGAIIAVVIKSILEVRTFDEKGEPY
jgi:predicted PurR-regulated permease PerM